MSTFKVSNEIVLELKKFKQYANQQEYTSSTTARYSIYLSRFLRQNGIPKENTVQAAIESFLKSEKVNNPATFKEARASLRLYYKMVTGKTLKKKHVISENSAYSDILLRFNDYSLKIKHLKEGTVASEIVHVRDFLDYVLEHNPKGFVDGLTAQDIRSYVLERMAGLTDSTKGRYITSIRNFFRCQQFYGQPVHSSVLLLPLTPAVWRKSAFPTTINKSIFEVLHEIPDKCTDVGKRNRCIVLCFTDLALRCSEVAQLMMDDFNWRNGTVAIRNTKNNSERILPLSKKLYIALIDYLKNVRPNSETRTLFVRFSHKRGEPMGVSQIRGVIRRNGSKAGLADNISGTHILRRTAASCLYNSGNSLKLTADILGHESLDSTTHYVKIDLSGLLSVASPWIGGGFDA